MSSSAKDRTKPNTSPLTTAVDERHSRSDAHASVAFVNEPETGELQRDFATHELNEFASLEPLAAAVDGMERTRIDNENRLRAITQMGGDISTDPDAAVFAAVVDGLTKLEHKAVAALQRAMRRHPLGPFVSNTVGLGAKQVARLLAAIGDPYLRDVYDEAGDFIGRKPRTVSQLWALCGYHVISVDHGTPENHARTVNGSDTDQRTPDAPIQSVGVAPSRRKGQRANWNHAAKMRAFLIAESCVKHRQSPYRAVYDEGRTKHADAAHAVPCVRCGPAGTPAEVGTPLSRGHQHARALRLVAKAILRDLWVEAKRLHETIEAAA